MHNFRTRCLHTANELVSLKMKVSQKDSKPLALPTNSTDLVSCVRSDDNDVNAGHSSDCEDKHYEELEFVQVDGNDVGIDCIQTWSGHASESESERGHGEVKQEAGPSTKRRKCSRGESNANGMSNDCMHLC